MTPVQIFTYALCYVIEGISAWFYFEHLFPRKHPGTYIAVFTTVVYTILFLLFLIGELLINSVLFCLGNVLILYVGYQCGKTAKIVHSAFMTVVMILTELVGALLIGLLIPYETLEAIHHAPGSVLAYGSSSKILYFLVLILFARLYRPRGNKKEESYGALLVSVMPVTSIIVSVIIVYFGYKVESSLWVNTLITVGTVALLASNFLVLAINNQLQKLAEERTELQLSMQKEKADADYYQMVQQQYDNQRVLIHDLKNYMGVLQSLAREGKTEDLQRYISTVEAMPELQKRVRWCDNAILNAMLLYYSERCEQRGVSFHCDIRKDSIFFDAISITALFGNLLSNALEAASKAEERSIEVSVMKSQGESVIITVVNSCDEAPPVNENGELKSRKRNKDGHGLGLKSIQRVVNQYNGISKMYYDAAEKQFHSVLRFPIPE